METHQEGNAAIPKVKLSFAYDNLGRRFKKTVHSNWVASAYQDVETSSYVYDRWNPVLEYTISGEGSLDGAAPAAPTHSFVWGFDLSGQRTGREEDAQNAGGIGGLLLMVNGSAGSAGADQTFVPGYDGNGNVVAYVNLGNGLPALAIDYDAFGNRVSTEALNGYAAEDFPIRFSTKYQDAETGLLYYGYRYYNPTTGRWLSRDPVQEKGSINLYAFVGNNGIGRIDVLGLYEYDGFDHEPTNFPGPLPPTTQPSTSEHLGDRTVGDQTDWFDDNFSGLIEQAKKNAKDHVKPLALAKFCAKRPKKLRVEGYVVLSVYPRNYTRPGRVPENSTSHVFDDAFGDSAQSVIDAAARLGRFHFRVAPQRINGMRNQSNVWEYTIEVEVRDNIGPWSGSPTTRGTWKVKDKVNCCKKSATDS